MDLLKVVACGLVKMAAHVNMNTVIQVLLRVRIERAVLYTGECADAPLLIELTRSAYGPSGKVTRPFEYAPLRHPSGSCVEVCRTPMYHSAMRGTLLMNGIRNMYMCMKPRAWCSWVIARS